MSKAGLNRIFIVSNGVWHDDNIMMFIFIWPTVSTTDTVHVLRNSRWHGQFFFFFLNGWFVQSNFCWTLFLSAAPALSHLYSSRWLSYFLSESHNIEFEWVSNRSLKSWVITFCFSQVDVKDEYAVGTRSCPQHAQHPAVCEVWACLRVILEMLGVGFDF